MNETTTMNLARAYTYAGKTYGPGPAEVPNVAVESITGREEAHQTRLLQGYEPPAPTTPSITNGNLVDPRKRPALAAPVVTPLGGPLGIDQPAPNLEIPASVKGKK
jgi:hypothetical protein